MSVALPAPRPAMRRARPAAKGKHFLRFLTFCLLIAGAVFLFNVEWYERMVLGPAYVLLTIALVFLNVLFARDGQLPVFDAGSMFVVAITFYGVIPLVQFFAAGSTVTIMSDNRMLAYAPLPQDMAKVARWYVGLSATFVVTYLIFRGGGRQPLPPVRRPDNATGFVIAAALGAIVLYFFALELYVGPVASVYAGGTGEEYAALPLVVQQLTHIFQMAKFTLKQFLLVFLFTRWERIGWRLACGGWLAFEIVTTVIERAGRAEMVLLLLTAIVLYHRMIRPLRPAFAIGMSVVMLSGFLALGIRRDMSLPPTERRQMLGMTNEFQGLFGNAYDLITRKEQRTLPPVPPQMYFADLYMLVPSQLLPFYKWNPSSWYGEVVGNTRIGFMFGFLAQAIIGYGWWELIVRAVLLAITFGLLHRYYRRHASSFWATNLYLFMLTWAYYNFRSTSFDFLYKLVYYFLPTVVAVLFLRLLLSRPAAALRTMRRRTAPEPTP